MSSIKSVRLKRERRLFVEVETSRLAVKMEKMETVYDPMLSVEKGAVEKQTTQKKNQYIATICGKILIYFTL